MFQDKKNYSFYFIFASVAVQIKIYYPGAQFLEFCFSKILLNFCLYIAG